MRTPICLGFVALVATLLLSSCNSKPYVLRESSLRTEGPRVAAVLDVKVHKIEAIGSAIDESPIPAGPNRVAECEVEKALAGEWEHAGIMKIYYDRHRARMAQGVRYFVMVDYYGKWLGWSEIDERGYVLLDQEKAPVPAAEAAAAMIGERFGSE